MLSCLSLLIFTYILGSDREHRWIYSLTEGLTTHGTYMDSWATRRIMKQHLFMKVSKRMVTAVGMGWIHASRVITAIINKDHTLLLGTYTLDVHIRLI